jgi:ribosomal protein L14
MRIRRLLALGGATAASAAGAVVVRRRATRRRDRAELYFDDGSLVTLQGPDAEPLLAHAREILTAARG